MILTDKLTSIKYNLGIYDSEIRLTEVVSNVVYTPIIVDDTTSEKWELAITNGQFNLINSIASPTINTTRDLINTNTIWEFKSIEGQLYLLEITSTVTGRIVFCFTNQVYTTYFLNCFIPQEDTKRL